MSKMKLYEIFGKHLVNTGVAEAPELEKDNLYFLPDGKPVQNWKTLHCIFVKGADFHDYQANTHRFRMCSQRLKDLLEFHASPDDRIQWLDVTITHNGETRPYYILHFYEDLDLVDIELSHWDGSTFNGEPVFVYEKIHNHNVFSIPQSCIMLFVKQEIIKEVKRQNLTGMTFGKILY